MVTERTPIAFDDEYAKMADECIGCVQAERLKEIEEFILMLIGFEGVWTTQTISARTSSRFPSKLRSLTGKGLILILSEMKAKHLILNKAGPIQQCEWTLMENEEKQKKERKQLIEVERNGTKFRLLSLENKRTANWNEPAVAAEVRVCGRIWTQKYLRWTALINALYINQLKGEKAWITHNVAISEKEMKRRLHLMKHGGRWKYDSLNAKNHDIADSKQPASDLRVSKKEWFRMYKQWRGLIHSLYLNQTKNQKSDQSLDVDEDEKVSVCSSYKRFNFGI